MSKISKVLTKVLLSVLLVLSVVQPMLGLSGVKAEEQEKKVFTFEKVVDTVAVNASFEEGVFAEEVDLSVTALQPETVGYQEAEKALEGADYDGMLAFDICFVSVATGEEVQPEGPVNIELSFREKAVAEVKEDGVDVETVAVTHITEENGPEVVAEAAEGTLEVTETAIEASFEVESFSTFTLTWKNAEDADESANVHWGTMNGETFEEFDAATLDTSAASVNLANTYDGYIYVGAYYTTAEETTGIDIDDVLTKIEHGWQTTATIHNEDETTTEDKEHVIPDGADIYVLYVEKTSDNTPPSSEGDDTVHGPEIEKTVTPNEDGTSTIRLEVTAPVVEEVDKKGANVLLVLDTTYSMRSSMTGATNRFEAARSASLTLIDTLQCDKNDIELALVEFNALGSIKYDWTKDYTTVRNYLANDAQAATSATGTNWEAGFYQAREVLKNKDTDDTYIIFLTDGEPNRTGTTTSTSTNATTARAAALNNQTNNITDATVSIYGVFCGTATGQANLQWLIDESPRGEKMIVGTDSDALKAAFEDIAHTIVNNLGSSNVSVDDGVPTLNSVSAMVSGDASGFVYEKKGPKDTEFSTWADAPGASYSKDNGVTWDLSKAGVLENETTYALEFKVWPSQEAYDLVANLNNGVISYDSLSDDVKAQISEVGDKYYIKTNTHLNATYTYNNKTYNDAYPYEEATIELVSEKMFVVKDWDDDINRRNRADKVEFYLLVDGKYYQKDGSFKETKDDAYILTTSNANSWSDEVEVAPGFATGEAGKELTMMETGHKYQLEEKAAYDKDGKPVTGYSMEFTSQTIRPLIVNGKLMYLVLADETYPTPEGATTYKIDGEEYWVSLDEEGEPGNVIVGTNHKTSELDITKKITKVKTDKTDAELDEETFTFEVTITAPEGSDVSGISYWIYTPSTGDNSWPLPEYDAGNPGADAAPDGYKDGQTFSGTKHETTAGGMTVTATITIKRNEVARLTNLPTGSTYKIVETKANDKDLASQYYTAVKDTIEGKVEDYDTRYYNRFENKLDEPETIDIEVTKTWSDGDDKDGIRPDSIIVILKADGTAVERATVTAKDEWKHTFSGMPKFNGEKEIKYTVEEEPVEGYKTEIKEFNIINTHEVEEPEVVEIKGTKTWVDDNDKDGLRPESITVILKADGEVIDSIEVTAKDEWKYSFGELPKYDGEKEIKYTVEEEPVEGYKTEIKEFNIINTHEVEEPEVVEIKGTKTWVDDNDKDGLRPESITVILKADGEVIDSIEVTAKDEWKYSFGELPKYDGEKEIKYTVDEKAVTGYTTTIEGYNITNTHKVTPPTGDESGLGLYTAIFTASMVALLAGCAYIVIRRKEEKAL